MNIKTGNTLFYKILLKHKNFYLNDNRINYSRPFPKELLDICIIIQWRYKKLKAELKKSNLKENELLFLEDNSIISAYGESILPPVRFEKNKIKIENPLEWFLYFELSGEKDKTRESIAEYLYLLCANPLLIVNNKELIGLIVKYAKQVLKQRKKGVKLFCLKVINTETNSSIFPMEEMVCQNMDKNKFSINIFRGDINKLKPRKT